MILGIQTTDPSPRPTFDFTAKLFSNMKLNWDGPPMPLLAPMLVVPVGGDGADAAAADATAADATAANEVSPPQPPPHVPPTPTSSSTPGPSFAAQDTPVREPTPSPVKEPTPFREPTPDSPRPPYPRSEEVGPTTSTRPPSPTRQTYFREDVSEGGGDYVSSPKSDEAPPTTAATAAGGAEDSAGLTALSLKLDRCINRVTSLENELGVPKKVLGGAVLKLVTRVKRLEGLLQQRKRRLVLSDFEGEEATTTKQDINLDALHKLASTSLGGDTTVEATYTIYTTSQDAHASSNAGHNEDEVPADTTMPFRRTRTTRRRLMKTVTSSTFEHFQENISADEDTIPSDAHTIPAGSTPIPSSRGVSAGSSMDPADQATAAPSSTIPAADKGKAPMVDDSFSADLLSEQEHILKNLHDYQLGEDLAKKHHAEQEAAFARQQEELAHKVPAAPSTAPAAPFIHADVSVPAALTIAADVSVSTAPSIPADTEVHADESCLDATQTASEHVSAEHTVDESTPSNMDITIDQQVAMDEALVPHAQILRIGRSNFRLLSDIKSKESTLQLEFWATATVHHHAIQFKMDNKKHIVNLESFRDMLHICLRVHGQSFAESLFKEEILDFIRFLGHRAAPPKPKASVWKTRSSSDTTITPLTAAADEGTGSIPGVLDVPTDESEEELSWNSTDEEGDDDDDDQEVERDDDKDDKEEGGDDEHEYDKEEYAEETKDEERHVEEEEEDELYRDIKINQGRGIQATLEVKDSHVTLTPVNPDGQQQSSSVSSQFVTSMLNPTLDVGIELIFKTTSQMDVQTPTSVAPLPMTAPTMTPSTIATITTTSQAPILPTTALSTIIQDPLNFGSLFGFDIRLRTLEANFSEFMQTNQFARASNRLCDEAQKENDKFLKTVDENMQKIIMENLYKALVEAYKSDKIILDTYEETVTLKRRHGDDADKDEEPSAGPDRGSKRRREGKEPESASAPK
nr:hypothetical protein [Tanacetum cinerariifolium]